MFESLKSAIGSRMAANAKVAKAAQKLASTATGVPIKKILPTSAASAAAQATLANPTMNYYMSTIRWHLDTREHASILLLHDLGSHANSWSQLNIEAASLPHKGLTPTVPLNLYMPHLRNHGEGHFIADSTIGDYVNDVVSFANEVILPSSPVHIVGLGFGARIGMLAALANPSRVESVTAITNGNPFGTLSVSAAKIEALAALVRECSSLAELDARLAETIPNETERLSLLLSVKETRLPEGKKLSLLMNGDEVAQYGGSSSSIGRWPQLSNEDGSAGEPDAVAAALRKHTGGVRCHVIKSSLGGATSVDQQRLGSYFTNTEVTEMPASFASGMIRREDTEVVLHKILDKAGLIGAMADSDIEGAKTAAEMMGV